MKNINKTLVITTLILLLAVLIVSLANFKYYSWTLWTVPVYFYILTYFLIKFLLAKADSPLLASFFSQMTILKLFAIFLFIFVFRFLLSKSQWLAFVGFSVINYLIYSAFEIKFLLKHFKK